MESCSRIMDQVRSNKNNNYQMTLESPFDMPSSFDEFDGSGGFEEAGNDAEDFFSENKKHRPINNDIKKEGINRANDKKKKLLKSTENKALRPLSASNVNKSVNDSRLINQNSNWLSVQKKQDVAAKKQISKSAVINKLAKSPFFGDADGDKELRKILHKTRPLVVLKRENSRPSSRGIDLPLSKPPSRELSNETYKTKKQESFSRAPDRSPYPSLNADASARVDSSVQGSFGTDVAVEKKRAVVAERLFREAASGVVLVDTSPSASAVDKLTYAERLQVMIMQVQDANNIS